MQPLLMSNPQDAYRKQGVFTASPAELIVMLFEALKKNLLLAQRAIGKNDPSTAHAKLMKAQDIIAELVSSLDMNYELAADLLDIYEFLIKEIAAINMVKDAERIPPIVEIVETFIVTWREVSQGSTGGLELLED